MRDSASSEKFIWVFVALIGLYVGLYFGLPVDPAALERYNLTEIGVRLLGLTVVVPLVAVFLFALYGFLRFRDYAISVAKSKEGPAWANLANGLTVLAFSLPVSSIVSSLLNYIARNNSDLLPTATIIRNYVSLILPFIAFVLVARGAEGLVKTLRGNNTIRHYNGLLVIIISCVFTWLITARPMSERGDTAYFLPNWLVISTLAIPYLYMWVRGIMAAFNLRLYQTNVKGKVYKKSLSHLAQGITGIVLLSITIQVIATLSARLERLSLTPILLLVYFLIAFYAVGYGLVARGAKKLKKIEEV